MDEPHPHIQVTFPFDSNIRYLPLVYLIPVDQIVRYPTLNTLPRCLSEIAVSKPMMDLLDSDAFLKDIMDAIAALTFPHFGFGGWKEHYTGYCPVWRLSYALPLWASLMEQECGWGLQLLFRMKPGTQIPFPDAEQVRKLFARVVKRAIAGQGWQPILDIVREMPAMKILKNGTPTPAKTFSAGGITPVPRRCRPFLWKECWKVAMTTVLSSIFQTQAKM